MKREELEKLSQDELIEIILSERTRLSLLKSMGDFHQKQAAGLKNALETIEGIISLAKSIVE